MVAGAPAAKKNNVREVGERSIFEWVALCVYRLYFGVTPRKRCQT